MHVRYLNLSIYSFGAMTFQPVNHFVLSRESAHLGQSCPLFPTMFNTLSRRTDLPQYEHVVFLNPGDEIGIVIRQVGIEPTVSPL
jgi:hypothetical protein